MDEIDLTNILKDWPYEPGNVNVRLIKAQDGRPLIQLRIDLGILQMEVRNRPDGKEMNGFPSLLDYHLHQIQLAQQNQKSGNDNESNSEDSDNPDINDKSPAPDTEVNGDDEPTSADEESHLEITFEEADDEDDEDFDETGEQTPPLYTINSDDCRAIREEAVQYYHRYIAFYALDEFDAVFDDATHNLQLIDICRHFAESQNDREAMEQLRLHTMMTRTRASAASIAAEGNTAKAVAAIDHGLAEIAAFLESIGLSEEEFDEVGEVQVLKSMRDALIPKLPGSRKVELQNRLRAALDSENYELAAILRDEIRMMKD